MAANLQCEGGVVSASCRLLPPRNGSTEQVPLLDTKLSLGKSFNNTQQGLGLFRFLLTPKGGRIGEKLKEPGSFWLLQKFIYFDARQIFEFWRHVFGPTCSNFGAIHLIFGGRIAKCLGRVLGGWVGPQNLQEVSVLVSERNILPIPRHANFCQ